jgi:hypothetical protein
MDLFLLIFWRKRSVNIKFVGWKDPHHHHVRDPWTYKKYVSYFLRIHFMTYLHNKFHISDLYCHLFSPLNQQLQTIFEQPLRFLVLYSTEASNHSASLCNINDKFQQMHFSISLLYI